MTRHNGANRHNTQMSARWLKLFLAIIVFFGVLLPLNVQAQGQTHTVQPGETLFRIALNYGTTVEALMAANNIADPSVIYVGQVLVIPGTAPAPTAPPPSDNSGSNAVPPASPGTYIVQPGDTLNIISRKLGVSVDALISANNLTDPNHIVPGQQLVIPGGSGQSNGGNPGPVAPPTALPPTAPPPPPTSVAPASQTGQTHIVQPGETLASIARQYNIAWPDLAAANNITDPNHIYAGMVLQIPVAGAPTTTMETSNGVPPGPVVSGGGKLIIVSLHEQRVYIYQDSQMVKSVLVSTGLPQFPTVQGDFRIYVKVRAQLMTGPGYYLPGVPWVMYFYEGYSFHGTYWHHNFGHPMSHGCVNMPTDEAKWLFDWADVGTAVHVQW